MLKVKKEPKSLPVDVRDGKIRVIFPVTLTCLFLVITTCLISSFRPMPVSAEMMPQADENQEGLRLKQLRVQVLPEYDDPRVLVIIQGRLDLPAEAFPLTVTFRIPVGAQINQMANLDMNTGGTVSQDYKTSPDPSSPDWSLITYTLNNAHFFYEYYLNQIEGEVSKSFTFKFYSLHDIEKFNLEIQKPLAASDFDLEPKADYTRLDEVFGFTYYCFNLGSFSKDEVIDVVINYTKSCTAPSLAKVNSDELMDAGSFTSAHLNFEGQEAPGEFSPWTVLILGSMITVGMVAFIWIKNNREPVNKLFLRIPKTLSCTSCNTRLVSGSSYCHNCGQETGRR
jgi:hypothetical protein